MPGLICDVCGLPTVPFGGEDICLSRAHEHGHEDGDWCDQCDEERGEGEDDDDDWR